MSEDRTHVQLPLEWQVPEGLITRYASNIVIQSTEHEYTISFFDAPLPIVIDTPEGTAEQLKKLGKIKAVCVARVVVAKSRFPEFVKVMQGQLDQVQKARDEG